MVRKVVEPIFTILFLFVTIFNMVCFAVDSFDYDMEDLPKGEHLVSSMSPDTDKTLRLYWVEIKDIGTAIRGEIATFENNVIQTKNIYWETHVDNQVPFGWIDEDTVVINQHIIDINGEPYDSRTQIELPAASAKSRMQE